LFIILSQKSFIFKLNSRFSGFFLSNARPVGFAFAIFPIFVRPKG